MFQKMLAGGFAGLACAVASSAAFGADGTDSSTELTDVYVNPVPDLRSRQPIFPNLVELEDGRLLTCFVIGEAMDAANARSHLAESTDGGKTWSAPWRMFPGNATETDYCKITALGGNRLMALGYAFVRPDPDAPMCNAATGGLLPDRVFVSFSEDAGRTWSERTSVPEHWGGHTEASGPVVKLADGTLATPITGFPDWEGKPTSRNCGRLLVSKDGGRSWSDEAITMAFPNDEVSVYEQRICQLDSGTIVDIAWNENLKTGKRLPNHISYSTDGGRTFSAPISTGIMGQAASVTALGGERFLAVVARRRDTDCPGVYGYVVDFSDKTWKVIKEKVLWEPGGGAIRRERGRAEIFAFLKFGQPSVIRLRNGKLRLILWYKADGQFHIGTGEVDL